MDLKPCPFCGGAAAFRWCGGVMLAECTSCGTSKGDRGASEDFEAAAAANWNARAVCVPTEALLKGWRCKADPSGVVPSDCAWPSCGCDPHVERVIRGLQESGWTVEQSIPSVDGRDFYELCQQYRHAKHDPVSEFDAIREYVRSGKLPWASYEIVR